MTGKPERLKFCNIEECKSMKIIFTPSGAYKRYSKNKPSVYWPGIQYETLQEAYDVLYKLNSKRKFQHAMIEIETDKYIPLAVIHLDNMSGKFRPWTMWCSWDHRNDNHMKLNENSLWQWLKYKD